MCIFSVEEADSDSTGYAQSQSSKFDSYFNRDFSDFVECSSQESPTLTKINKQIKNWQARKGSPVEILSPWNTLFVSAQSCRLSLRDWPTIHRVETGKTGMTRKPQEKKNKRKKNARIMEGAGKEARRHCNTTGLLSSKQRTTIIFLISWCHGLLSRPLSFKFPIALSWISCHVNVYSIYWLIILDWLHQWCLQRWYLALWLLLRSTALICCSYIKIMCKDSLWLKLNCIRICSMGELCILKWEWHIGTRPLNYLRSHFVLYRCCLCL